MSAPPPVLDPRGYQELLDEALARIPVHNPEWTNFNRSDPGVTMIEVFAFLTEALTYRANQIPERSRRAFLALLGAPVTPAAPARGIVAFVNERAAAATITVDAGLEVRAGEVPFQTQAGLDILPVEGRAFVKRRIADPAPEILRYYQQLYASHRGEQPDRSAIELYETVPVDRAVALGETADSSLWVALAVREEGMDLKEVRKTLAGKTVSLGIVPAVQDPRAALGPASLAPSPPALEFELPAVPPDGVLGQDPAGRVARYRRLDGRTTANVLVEPGVVEITLPDDWEALELWSDLDPLEAGAGDFPPSLEATDLDPRLVTWLRMRAPAGTDARVQWAGINAVPVSQRVRVVGEALPAGTGDPDQAARLARVPVVEGSLTIEVGDPPERWTAIEHLALAEPEIPAGAPGAANVFVLDPATGEVRFGDGTQGRRPPRHAVMRASYDVATGRAGNVAAGAITTAPALPAGVRVTNPVATWGGADAASVAKAEQQAVRFLRHRDRLVAADDFDAIVRRTPGVELGRVEVLPTFNPQATPPVPTPGAVTLLVIPAADPAHPAAPEPDRLFLDAVCRYLDPRRLVTTEVFLRGPAYVDLWISVGIAVEPGRSAAVVREAVRRAVLRFLAPLDPGWPLGKAVHRLELAAVANRVDGVQMVNDVKLAAGLGGAVERVELTGLELPRVRAVDVGTEAADPDELRGRGAAPASGPPSRAVPVPVVPEEC